MSASWHRSVRPPRSAPAGRGRRIAIGPVGGELVGIPTAPSPGPRGLALGAALLAAAASGLSPPATTLMAQERPTAGGTIEADHTAEGVERHYRLVIPEAAADGRALVVMLHGCTQDADDFATGTRMDRYALHRGFLVLYPEQPASLHPQRCWRWYDEANQRRDAGEAAQLVAMIRHVMEEQSVDPGRIYLAGMSAGGAMALAMAATHPGLFAAVVSHSGVAYGAARNQAEAVAAMAGKGPGSDTLAGRLSGALERARSESLPPLLIIHGSEDGAVDPSNAGAIAEAWLLAGSPRADPPPPDRQMPGQSASRGEKGPAVSTEIWERDGETFVRLSTVSALGHAWSGGDPAGSYTDPAGPNATERVLSFFARAAGDEALLWDRSETGGSGDVDPGAEGDTRGATTGAGGP